MTTKKKKKRLLTLSNLLFPPERILFLLAVFACLLVGLSNSFAGEVHPDDIIGVWLIERDGAAAEHIEIYQCDGFYCGKIVWLKSEDESADPVLDVKNKNDDLKSRPLLNLEIIKNYQFDGVDWWHDGEFYSHRRGKSASPKFTLIDANHLEVRVKILLFKKTFVWRRVPAQAP